MLLNKPKPVPFTLMSSMNRSDTGIPLIVLQSILQLRGLWLERRGGNTGGGPQTSFWGSIVTLTRQGKPSHRTCIDPYNLTPIP